MVSFSLRQFGWRVAYSALLDTRNAPSSVNSFMMPPSEGVSRPPRHAWKKNKVFQFLASLRLAVTLLSVLIIMSIVGTIAESKFDSDTSRVWIYEAPWFHLWLALLAANLICSALMRWPWRRHHTGFLLTHLGIIVVMVGSVVGQVWGVEGTMTLLQGSEPDNVLVLQTRQMTIRDTDAQRAVMIQLGRRPLSVREDRPVPLWNSPGGWNIEAVASSSRLLGTFEPSATPGGKTAVRVRLQTKAMNQTIDHWLLVGDRNHGRLDLGLITVDLVGPGEEAPPNGAANRAIVRSGLDAGLSVDLLAGPRKAASAPLVPGQPVATGWNDWTIEAVQVLPAAAPAFRFAPLPAGKPTPPGQPLLDGVLVRVTRADAKIEQWVAAGWRVGFPTGAFPIDVSYGWEVYRLPFGLVLDSFVVERNEGTDDPASFRSNLAMLQPDGARVATGSCSMNQPANYPQAWWRSMTGLTYKISQASWNPNDLGQSSVQILRDPGWLGKWVGSLILVSGLVLMFVFRRPSEHSPAPKTFASPSEPVLTHAS